MSEPRPTDFDLRVVPGGYAWWYVDAISDDGRHALTLIMFVGSVFSSRYARARKQLGDGRTHVADPEHFCAVNFALYRLDGGGPGVWALTEHGSFARDRDHLEVGNSSMRWDGGELCVELDEHATRFFGRAGPPLRGRLRLRPSASFGPRVELDPWQPHPRHRWYPVAPHARVELELDEPRLRFSGSGYHDVNEGDEGLELAFASWNWSRCELGEATVIAYDVVDHAGREHARAWRFEPGTGTITDIPAAQLGPTTALPKTRWRVPRSIRSDPDFAPALLHTLEDTPFYSRNLVRVGLGGESGTAMHESIDLRRFASAWVRLLLPFKIRYLALTGQPASSSD